MAKASNHQRLGGSLTDDLQPSSQRVADKFAGPSRKNQAFDWMQEDEGDGIATGPSSSQSPYIVPLDKQVNFTSILTTGDIVADTDGKPDALYKMAGIPDGLGAYDNGDGTFTVLMNHEIGASLGAVREHGAKGAFVSEYIIDKNTLTVISGDDLIKKVMVYNTTTGQYESAITALDRLCSGDLPDQSAFDFGGAFGYEGLIYLSGEESSNGRAFAHVATGDEKGTSYELASLGNQAWENLLANPDTGKKTVVIGLDDTTPGELFVYVGDKQATGNAVEQAGLVGGKLYGIAVKGVTDEDRADGIDPTKDGNIDFSKSTFSLVALGDNGDVSKLNGTQLEASAEANSVTDFLRPEDGQWDPTNSNVFYFVTTDTFNAKEAYGVEGSPDVGQSRLYKLTFDNASDPTKGGKIEMLLDGSELTNMMDNMTVNSKGQILLQEDPGGQDYSAKIWLYDPKLDTRTAGTDSGNTGLRLLAEHDPLRFGDRDADPSTPTVVAQAPFTNNEESSGIIDVSGILGRKGEDVYLLDVQAHYPSGDPETVEGGQLLAMTIETGSNHIGSDHNNSSQHDWFFG